MIKMKSKAIHIITALLPLVAVPLCLLFREYSRTAPPCPLNLFTGIYCLGCGGTRCISALLHGKILLALRQNAIVVAVAVFLLLLWFQSISALLGGKIKILPENRRFYAVASGIMLVYAVLRNFIPEIAPV